MKFKNSNTFVPNKFFTAFKHFRNMNLDYYIFQKKFKSDFSITHVPKKFTTGTEFRVVPLLI